MASTYLKRDITSDGNKKIFTFSMWVKRGTLGSSPRLLMGYDASSGEDFFQFNSNDKIKIASANGVSYLLDLDSTRVFRDTNAWYHLVLAYDSTQATSSNRVKLYVNNEQETLVGTFPTQNNDILFWNTSGDDIDIGGRSKNNDLYFDGSMSHVHFIDGTAYDATAFGEYDANGVWTINTSPSVTYGTNGFFILKDGNSVTDQSGNTNNFTVAGGTLTKTEDCPDNVFATMNPLASQSGSSSSSSAFTFSNGNLSVSNITSETGIANLGVSTGKWFWEVKVITDQAGLAIGACNDGQNLDDELGYQSGSSQSNAKVFGYYGDNGNKYTTMGDGSQMSAYGSAISVNDIVGVAMNLDDNQVTFYLNGSSQGTFSITALGSGEVYFPAVGNWSVATIAVDFNFGNGYFGTTPVASAGTNASGIGIFEYDVPTGYTALSTKGLNL